VERQQCQRQMPTFPTVSFSIVGFKSLQKCANGYLRHDATVPFGPFGSIRC
jgi:hypothetical protein